ncbi:PREDICTED: 5'-adenylylsulfate reductase [Prunus dulcis]|uniref:PREDICTED: 5'-adenylylsulfate reductase n=1 Tax=Prunus dulcis TaxID=3755 RepID=A0A5E4ERX2_PRUDU|nr:PREDICTED: 5'-adenylylsulfate reductase [Prunus dulcis]
MVSLSKILYPNSGSLLLDEDLNVASFQGLDGATGSLVIMAWNRKANIGSQEMHQYLNFLQVVQAMDVPAVSLHYCSRELLSTATFKPCNIMLLLFCQREWEGRWRRRWWWRWWLEEVIKIKECGLKTGDVKLENPCAPLLVVLFNIWCHIFQALAEGQKAGTSDDEHHTCIPIKHSSERAQADNDLYLMASVDVLFDDEDHDQSPMDLLVWNTRIS